MMYVRRVSFLIDNEQNEPTDDSRLLSTLQLARVYISDAIKRADVFLTSLPTL